MPDNKLDLDLVDDLMRRAMSAPTLGPPTWDEIERAALYCGYLYHAVSMVAHGVSKEQALIAVALALSKDRADYMAREVARLRREPGP